MPRPKLLRQMPHLVCAQLGVMDPSCDMMYPGVLIASHNFQAQKTAGGNAIISSDYYCISPVTVSDNFQEFVSASELLEHGFPVSSPSGVEPAGSVASVAASSHMI